MTELFTDINGIKISYEIQGEGEPIILVHGFGAKKQSWIGQFEPLSKEFKVIRLDNRGSGKSDRPNQPYTLDIFADDVRGLMDFLKIDKANIIGWSLGGMIVQKFALKYPERLNKLVLLLTVPGTPDESGPEFLQKSWLEDLELIMKDPEKAFWQSAHVLHHIKFRKELQANPTKKFYDLWSAEDLIKESTIDPPTPQDIKNQANAIKMERMIGNLDEIEAETQLIAGSHDRLCPKAVMEEMSKKIPNSTFEVIDKAGHAAPRSRAPEVNKLIIDFLKK